MPWSDGCATATTATHTAHDYGEDFAESTLRLLPAFIHDAKALADVIEGVEG